MSSSITPPEVPPSSDLLLALADKQARAAAKKARKEDRRAERRALEQEAKELGLSGDAAKAVNLAAAKSVANRALPPIPPNLGPDAITICLFYQYKEPAWTTKQHKAALNYISALAGTHSITGRGRCAPEGLNCTVTGTALDMRAFCYALRAWDPALFTQTDFKLEDGVAASTNFRTFTLRKVDELVGYGLNGIKAPSLNHHGGTHLEAHQYHAQMQQKDTVIIDVRNAYESDIGHFQPPKDGATLLDPKMRNSTDFPKWLNAPETKEKLNGKTVMMYCTGGIRCERATALLNQMTDASKEDGSSFQTKDVVMVRGGIERYLKTFPEGGFWKGKNYLFDKRMEQVPEGKKKIAADDKDDDDPKSICCLCKTPHAEYRGQHKCSRPLAANGLPCNVPVIVCPSCQDVASKEPETLACPLCVAGYQPPTAVPDLVGQKRKLGIIDGDNKDQVTGKLVSSLKRSKDNNTTEPSQRLFLGRLPLTVTASAIRRATAPYRFETVHWIVDHDSHAFYGSAFLQMETFEDAKKLVAATEGVLTIPSRRKKQKTRTSRVAFAPLRADETWPSAADQNYKETEYPPIGINP
jgi:predicted sulfurtransferase